MRLLARGLLGALLERRDRAEPGDLADHKHRALARLPDAALSDAYYRLRDQAEQTPAGPHYPNLGRLHGTALEREKDRREIRAGMARSDVPEMQAWYARAAERPATEWLETHWIAKNSLHSCMACGVCSAQCPAARYSDEYNPRAIVDVVVSRDETRITELLRSDLLWLCAQCGSCKPGCPRGNSIVGLVSSLRLLAQLKGLNRDSVRGRQQYAARHLWGGNFWNRGQSMHFRNVTPQTHPDFGPRYARYYADCVGHMRRLGAHPDTDGSFGGRKITPESLAELRACVRVGGTLLLWDRIEQSAARDAAERGQDIDDYLAEVARQG